MARIKTYPFDTNVIGADKIVGTDAISGNTKSLDIYKANGIQNTVSIRRIV